MLSLTRAVVDEKRYEMRNIETFGNERMILMSLRTAVLPLVPLVGSSPSVRHLYRKETGD